MQPPPKSSLRSNLFKDDQKLKRCLMSDPDHVLLGAQGEHVGKIQEALVILGAGFIDPSEIRAMKYGRSTADTVLRYKGPPRNIINIAYQKTPDNIVGRMTINWLDEDMFAFENRPSAPPPLWDIFVSMTPEGEPHDHDKCPTTPYVTSPGPDGHAQHKGSPIYPQAHGKMINIWGEGETNYVGFQDYATHRDGEFLFPHRPLTQTIGSRSVSDICMRSSPLHRITGFEMQRLAMPGCRFTYASNAGFIGHNVRGFIMSMGTLVHSVMLPGSMEALVVSCDISKPWRLDLLPEHNR
jgi:hypothetical protein